MSAPVQLMFRGSTGRWWRLCRLHLRVPQAAALQGRTYNVSRFPVITVNKQIISNICNVGFQQEPRFWARVKSLHQEALGIFESLRRQASFKRSLEPEILLQPETRLISYEQLFVEVKGIYAGLLMVEKKCIVDGKQSQAALEEIALALPS